MIKLFACDLDGTLLNAFHRTDRVILDAVREVTAAGARFAVATGRNVVLPDDVGLGGTSTDIVCSNGSIVRDERGNLEALFAIDKEALEDLLTTLPEICFECVTEGDILVRGSREQREAGFKRDNPVKRMIMRGMRAGIPRRAFLGGEMVFDRSVGEILEHDVCKVNCRIADEGLKRELYAYLDAHADAIVNAPFNPSMFEITRSGVNKGASIAWLARRHGIAEDEIAVYGDGGNDIVMLERFEHAYATSNGSDDAKRAAGTVIGSCMFHAVPRHMVLTVRRERARTVIE